jgi:cytochrome c556
MTKPNAKNAALAALTAVALALVLAGCGAGTSGEDPAEEAARAGAPKQGSSPHTGDYAGKVEGTEVFVAVVVDKEDRALAYLYDGRTDRLPRGPSGSPGLWQTTAPSTSRAREKCASRRRSA